jgi:hypothetical protein
MQAADRECCKELMETEQTLATTIACGPQRWSLPPFMACGELQIVSFETKMNVSALQPACCSVARPPLPP